jgi:hypothetical protein
LRTREPDAVAGARSGGRQGLVAAGAEAVVSACGGGRRKLATAICIRGSSWRQVLAAAGDGCPPKLEVAAAAVRDGQPRLEPEVAAAAAHSGDAK